MDKISTFRKLNKASQILEMLEILVSACEASGKKLPLQGVMHNIKISKDEITSVLKDFEEPISAPGNTICNNSKQPLSDNSLRLEKKNSSTLSTNKFSDFALSVSELPKDDDTLPSKDKSEKPNITSGSTPSLNPESELKLDSPSKKVSISDRIRAIPRVRTFNINE